MAGAPTGRVAEVAGEVLAGFHSPWNSRWHNPWNSPWHNPWHNPWNSPWNNPWNSLWHNPWRSLWRSPLGTSLAPLGRCGGCGW
jgi:hypothetical protein